MKNERKCRICGCWESEHIVTDGKSCPTVFEPEEEPETWVRCPNCGVDFVAEEYAFDPEEEEEKPVQMDWSALPAWAGWIAMDANEAWYWFMTQPVKRDDYWGYDEDDFSKHNSKYGLIPDEHAPDVVDWELSLTRVPREEGE